MTELKPWARRVVTAYIVLLVPVLLGLLVVLVMVAPRIFATAYDSFGLQTDRVADAISDGAVALATLGVLQVLLLLLPCLAIVLTATRLGRRGLSALFGWASGSALRTTFATVATLAVAGFAAWTWWPNGDYEPIRPGERGTLSEVASSVTAIPSGRPAWTPAREAEHGDKSTVRERRADELDTTSRERRRERQREREREREREQRQGAAPTDTTTTPAAEEPEPAPEAVPEPAPEEAPPVQTTPAPPVQEPVPQAPVAPPPVETTPVPPP